MPQSSDQNLQTQNNNVPLQSEPFVLVKKADGTQEKIPVSKLMQKFSVVKKQEAPAVAQEKKFKTPPPPPPPPLKPIKKPAEKRSVFKEQPPVVIKQNEISKPTQIFKTETQKKSNAQADSLAVETTYELATTTPVKNIFIDEAKAKTAVWDEIDHKSLLDDNENEKFDKTLSAVPSKRENMIQAVLNKLSFSLPDYLKDRLSSIIQSRVKEIRNDDQFVDYATRQTSAGGLGLETNDANELLEVVLAITRMTRSHAPAKKPVQTQRAPAQKQEINATFTQQKATSLQSKMLDYHFEAKRPVLHDIKAPPVQSQAKVVGPVDELRSITITDMRRLGSNPEQIEQALKNKFLLLKQESYLMYLDGVNGWYQSPLYLLYQETVRRAVNDKKHLSEVVKEVGLTMDEVKAIAGVGKSLVI